MILKQTSVINDYTTSSSTHLCLLALKAAVSIAIIKRRIRTTAGNTHNAKMMMCIIILSTVWFAPPLRLMAACAIYRSERSIDRYRTGCFLITRVYILAYYYAIRGFEGWIAVSKLIRHQTELLRRCVWPRLSIFAYGGTPSDHFSLVIALSLERSNAPY